MVSRVKLGATLFFDSEQEKDIVEEVDKLRSQHKLGGYINNTIRFAYKYKEQFDKEFGTVDSISGDRKKFFKDITKQVDELRYKIDSIYEMTNKLYMLAMFGKKLGLEDRAKNVMMAQFLLRKQTDDLCNVLGISKLDSNYTSEKIIEVNKNVEEILEFIINYYDGVVNEIKDSCKQSKPDIAEGLELTKESVRLAKKNVDQLENSSYIRGNEKITKFANSIKTNSNLVVEDDINDNSDEEDVADLDGLASMSSMLL
jgi:hypothetical protein